MKLAISYPEWQGCGENPAVYFGALKVIERIFNDEDFVHVDVPIEETLEVTKGVFGLNSIAPRFQRTIHDLRQRNPSTILMVAVHVALRSLPLDTLMKSMMEISRWFGWTPTGILTLPNRRPADTSTVWR